MIGIEGEEEKSGRRRGLISGCGSRGSEINANHEMINSMLKMLDEERRRWWGKKSNAVSSDSTVGGPYNGH